MQAAGKGVSAAGTLVELAARMQAGEDDFHGRHFFLGMQADRDAAPVVFDADAAVDIQGHHDLLAIAAQGFVGGVVDHFLDDVQRVFGARVHAGPLLDRLQPFKNADGGFAVIGCGRFFGCHAMGIFR